MTKLFLGYKVDEIPSEVPGLRHMPAGRYLMQVEDMTDFPTWEKDSTTPALERQIRITMTIMDCPANVAKEEVVGRSFSEFISKKPTVAFRVKQFTDATIGQAAVGEELDTDMFKGKMVVVQVKDDTYTKDGQTQLRSRVDRFFPGTDWKGAVAAPKAAAPAASAASSAPAPAASAAPAPTDEAPIDLANVL